MAATNLETEARCHVNSPRDLADASEVSVATDTSVALDGTSGGTFVNTGNQLLIFSWAGGDSDASVAHILRNGAQSEYVGADFGDDAGHAYDVISIPTNNSDAGFLAVGPFDPKRYNDANGLLTVLPTGDFGTIQCGVLDIASRRTARSTPTKGFRYDESSTTQSGPVD